MENLATLSLLAFLPILVIGDTAGHELVHPMAIVVLCGLLTSTAVTLFVVPLLYLLVGSRITETESDMELFESEERVRADLGFPREPALVGAGPGGNGTGTNGTGTNGTTPAHVTGPGKSES